MPQINTQNECLTSKTGYGKGKTQPEISHWKGVCMAIFFTRKQSCPFRVEVQEFFCMCFTQTQGYLFEYRAIGFSISFIQEDFLFLHHW